LVALKLGHLTWQTNEVIITDHKHLTLGVQNFIKAHIKHYWDSGDFITSFVPHHFNSSGITQFLFLKNNFTLYILCYTRKIIV